jgi:peptidoglycan/LPS O-acetylase OafA/YrhL
MALTPGADAPPAEAPAIHGTQGAARQHGTAAGYVVLGELREPTLDGVRGLALVMVLSMHLFWIRPGDALTSALSRLIWSMGIGLDLFFVLSGYLITGILLRSKGASNYYRSFYARRVLRIFPAYYLTLLHLFAVLPVVSPWVAGTGLRDYAGYFLLYVQNLWMVATSGRFPWLGVDHLWSLAIEEHFYLLWPLAVAYTGLGGLRRVCVAVLCLSVVLKALLVFTGGSAWTIALSTATRCDGLLIGALIATLSTADVERVRAPVFWTGTIASAGLAGLILAGPLDASPGSTALSIVLACLLFGWLLFAVHAGTLPDWMRSALQAPWLTWLGRYSYGIYLLHFPVAVMVWGRLGSHFGISDAAGVDVALFNGYAILCGSITLAITLPAAVVMFKLVEAPALRLRRRFAPRRDARGVAPGDATEGARSGATR